MWWELVCHKTEWQQHYVLRNCSSALSIYSFPQSIRQVKTGGRGVYWLSTRLIRWACWISHLTAGPLSGFQSFWSGWIFCTIILWLEKTIKPFFLSLEILRPQRTPAAELCHTENCCTASLLAAWYSLSYVYVYMSYLFFVNVCRLYWSGNWTRPTARGCHGDILAKHGEIKNGLVALAVQKHRTWVDGYSCLCLHSYTQVGYY